MLCIVHCRYSYSEQHFIVGSTFKSTQMKNTRRLLKLAPEVYFIAFAIWWAAGSSVINYPAIILASILILQFFVTNKTMGWLFQHCYV
jgi:hypothetical protein